MDSYDRPLDAARRPWQRRIEVFSPKLRRAHSLDLRLTILDSDPFGQEQVLGIERVCLLAIIDVATRAIL